MNSKLERLEKYIRANYKTQEEFAKAIGLTRSGLRYIISQAKINGGELNVDFLLRLEHRKINIFENVFEDNNVSKIVKEPSEKYANAAEIIRTQRELIESLQENIVYLKQQLRIYDADVGKAGARSTYK